MRRYEMLAFEDNLYLKKETALKTTFYRNNKAFKELNKILNHDFNGEVKVAYSEDKADKYLLTDSVEIRLIEYEDLLRTLEEKYMSDEPDAKKTRLKKTVGTTTVALGIGAAALASLISAKTPSDINNVVLEVQAMPIESTKDEIVGVSEEKSNEILTQELNFNDVVFDNESDYTYSETPYEVSMPTIDSSISVDVIPNYDTGLEENVSRYDEIIQKVSDKWGVPANLVRDIMKQESSGGNDINMMQIQFNSWKGQIIKVYNFEKNDYETIVFTDEPEKYAGKVNQTISREEFKNPYTNISLGAMILAYSYEQLEHNLAAAIQGYNYGVPAEQVVITRKANEEGRTYEELIKDTKDTSYLGDRYKLDESYGDPNYAQKVFGMSASEEGTTYTFKVYNKATKEIEIITSQVFPNEKEEVL